MRARLAITLGLPRSLGQRIVLVVSGAAGPGSGGLLQDRRSSLAGQLAPGPFPALNSGWIAAALRR